MSTKGPAGPILFCFDGSEGSFSALGQAAALIAPRAAVVLTVWETVAVRLATSAISPASMSYFPDESDADAQEQAAAQHAADRGARAAQARGWEAVARVESAELVVWRTVLDVADELDASLIVCGARGLNAIKRSILGSVSEAILHHSHRTALISHQH